MYLTFVFAFWLYLTIDAIVNRVHPFQWLLWTVVGANPVGFVLFVCFRKKYWSTKRRLYTLLCFVLFMTLSFLTIKVNNNQSVKNMSRYQDTQFDTITETAIYAMCLPISAAKDLLEKPRKGCKCF